MNKRNFALIFSVSLILLFGCSDNPGTNSANEPQAPLPEPNPQPNPEPMPNPLNPLINEASPFGIHGIESAADLSELGVKWFRPGIHPGAGKFKSKMQVFDEKYAEMNSKEIMAMDNFLVFGKEDGSCLPENLEEEKKGIQLIAERYDNDSINDAPEINGVKPVVLYWQIGNEVDSHPGQACSPKEYVKSLKFYYEAIKESCENCTVLMSGIVSNQKEYISLALDEGAGNYLDAFDVHLFGTQDYYSKFGGIYAELMQVQKEHGINKPVWIIETGSPTGNNDGTMQSEEDQAAVLVGVMVNGIGVGFEKIFWAWGLNEGFGGNGNDFFDQTGLIFDGKGSNDRGAGIKKKSYYAYRKLIEKLDGTEFKTMKKIPLGKNIYGYELRKENEFIYVLWLDYFREPENTAKTISFEFEGKKAKITELIVNESNEFKEFELIPENKIISIELGKSPVIIEGGKIRENGMLSEN